MTAQNLSVQQFVDERLKNEGVGLVTREKFARVSGRLLASGVLWRDYSAAEAALYDDARQCEQLLREWFSVLGFMLIHDVDALVFRLYPPGDSEEEEGVRRLRARLSYDFIASCLALRFLYTEGLTGKRELVNQELLINLEELSQTSVSLLGYTLPGSLAERVTLLRELRKHRLIRFNDGEGAGSMETILSILRPVMSFVSDEALEDVLRLTRERIPATEPVDEAP